MNDYLLTFEVEENEQLFIHGDAAGLEFFAGQLLKIAAEAKKGEFPHEHYFTKEWGGHELSSEQQSQISTLINHVKVFGWPTIKGAKPYAKT